MTHENKDKKIKNRPAFKDEFVLLLESSKNAVRLLERIESWKEGKIVETSISELPQK